MKKINYPLPELELQVPEKILINHKLQQNQVATKKNYKTIYNNQQK